MLTSTMPAPAPVAFPEVGDRHHYHQQWDAHTGCHDVDYAGYLVIRTIADNGVRIVEQGGGLVEHVIDGAGRYAEALELAHAIRHNGWGWAVVGSVYTCGHVLY